MKIKTDKVFKKQKVVEVEFNPGVLVTEVILRTESGVVAKYLLADAPTWVRDLYIEKVLS